MGKATMHNGRAIVAYSAQGEAMDSEGKIIEGAPKPPKDTPRAEILPSLAPEDRVATAIAKAIVSGNVATLVPPKEEEK